MNKNYAVFIPRHYPKDNDCWRGIWSYEESEYRSVNSFDPDLHALARDLEPGVIFFAVFYGTYFLFVERQTMRSFKCAYGHHRKVIYYLHYQRSGTAFTEAFTHCINKATGTQSSDGLLRTGDSKPPHAVFIPAGLDFDLILDFVIRREYSTDYYPYLIQNMSEVDLQDISALIERVRTYECRLNQDFFTISDDEVTSRFVNMSTGEVFKCYDDNRQHIVNVLRSDPSVFGKLKEMAEECIDKIYWADLNAEYVESFLNEDECDGKLYAMDGTELKDGDVVHIDLFEAAGSVDVSESTLYGAPRDAKEVSAFRVRMVDGRWYLREALKDGSDGRYLSGEVREVHDYEGDSPRAVLKGNDIPTEDQRVVFRRHKVFNYLTIMTKTTNKRGVANITWFDATYGAISFETARDTNLTFQFVRSEPL